MLHARRAIDRPAEKREHSLPYLSRGYLIANIFKSRFRETRPRVAVGSAIGENQSRVREATLALSIR